MDAQFLFEEIGSKKCGVTLQSLFRVMSDRVEKLVM